MQTVNSSPTNTVCSSPTSIASSPISNTSISSPATTVNSSTATTINSFSINTYWQFLLNRFCSCLESLISSCPTRLLFPGQEPGGDGPPWCSAWTLSGSSYLAQSVLIMLSVCLARPWAGWGQVEINQPCTAMPLSCPATRQQPYMLICNCYNLC